MNRAGWRVMTSWPQSGTTSRRASGTGGRGPSRGRPARTGRGRRWRRASERSTARSSRGLSSGWVATSWAMAGSRRCQAPSPWTGSCRAGEFRRPGGIVAQDPLRIHEPARHARPRLALGRDADQDQRAQPLRAAGREGHRGHRAHREPEQVERGEAERVHEGLEVRGQERLGEPVGHVPAGPPVAAGIGHVDAERLAHGRELGREVLPPGRGRAVQDHQRETRCPRRRSRPRARRRARMASRQASGLPSTSVAVARSTPR